jgi:ATP-dependent helicase/nuclease subunit A
LTSPAFAPLFGPGSRAEVPIVAEVPRPPGVRPGPPLRLTGQIDRLALTAREVLIVDYKTNRPPPLRVEDVARAYLLQLAAYTLALRQIYRDREVQAALLWTDGPRIQPIPTALIERHITQLWDLDPSNLDAGGPRS